MIANDGDLEHKEIHGGVAKGSYSYHHLVTARCNVEDDLIRIWGRERHSLPTFSTFHNPILYIF